MEHDASGMLGEQREQVEFLACEGEFDGADIGNSRDLVDREVADCGITRFVVPACKRSKSCKQFCERKGLDQVIICAGVQAGDAILDAVPSGQHQDVTIDVQVAKAAADGESVQPSGQHHVENDRVVAVVFGFGDGVTPVVDNIGSNPDLGEPPLERCGSFLVVLCHEHLHVGHYPALVTDLFDPAAWALAPGVLHLNHGSFGAVPNAVRAAQDGWRDIISSNPTGFISRRLPEEFDAVRSAAAAFLRADPRGLVLVPSVTWAAAIVMASVPLGHGDEVLISDDTYQGVRAVAEAACARTGARLIQAHLQPGGFGDGAAITRAMDQTLTARTKLAIIDHITSPTAALIDPVPIVQRCHANGTVVLVDGAHAPGMLALDVEQCGADFYAGAFHKWCCAPLGAAFLAVAPEWRGSMVSPAPGSESDQDFPTALEWWGTMDYSGVLATPTALELLRDAGVDRLRERNANLVNAGAALVSRALEQEPAAPGPIAMVTLELPSRMSTTAAGCRLLRGRVATELGAEVVITMARGRAVLRLSAQAYNREDDFQQLAAYLAALQ
jgi:isopenicillin-N epimerase